MHVALANLTSRPIIALLAFTAWTLLLVGSILITRTVLVALGKKKANEFPASVQHGTDRYWRLNRAHLNALENLPIFAAIVLGGAALGVSSPTLAKLSEFVVFARIAQSSLHILSGSASIVLLRGTAFGLQIVAMFWMLVETLKLCLP